MVKKIIIYIILYIFTILILGVAIFWNNTSLNNYYHFLKVIVHVFIVLLIIKYSKTIFFILISPWNKVIKKVRELKCQKKATNFKPLVSIIVPAYNEEVGLLNTIKTALKSRYKNVEIVVVNDGSRDSSHDIMLNFLDLYYEDVNAEYSYKKII